MADYYETRNRETGLARLVILYANSEVDSVDSTHPRYAELSSALREQASDEAIREIIRSEELALATRLVEITDRISVTNGEVCVDGVATHTSLTQHILQMLENGDNEYIRVVRFYENLLQNPSAHSREQLYEWLLSNDMFSLTEDGHVIGYKGVTPEQTSYRSGEAFVNGELKRGRIPYPIGAVAMMPRDQVTANPEIACSYGLHIGTWDFAKGFGQKILTAIFNPRDVVSVPSHDTRKLRACRFKAEAVVENPEYTTSYRANQDNLSGYFDEAYDGSFKV